MGERHFFNSSQYQPGCQDLPERDVTLSTLLGAITRSLKARAELDGEVTVQDIRHALALGGRGITSSGTVYVGVAGLAYMYWHLAGHVKRGLVLEDAVLSSPEPSLVASASAQSHGVARPVLQAEVAQIAPQSNDAMTRNVTASALYREALKMCHAAKPKLHLHAEQRITFLEGYSGVLALECALHAELEQHEELQRSVEVLVRYAEVVAQSLPAKECEVLYGKTGLLYSLLFVDSACPGVTLPAHLLQRSDSEGVEPYESQVIAVTNLIKELVAGCIKEGKRCVASAARSVDPNLATAGLLFEWHGKCYLGAAHGVLGILQTITHASKFVTTMEAAADIEFVTKKALLTVAGPMSLPSGNVPSALGNDHDRLVQWCHGAPGMLMALSAMHANFGSVHMFNFQSYMKRFAAVIWERGLVRKGLGLCHGIAGNGYAFLSAYRATGDVQYLDKARAFGLFACDVREELLSVPDHPFSLYEGVAGAVCFWADLIYPDNSHFPGFELPSL